MIKEETGMADQKTVRCQICGEVKQQNEVVPAELIHASIIDMITREHPALSPAGYICHADLNRFRTAYVRHVLEKEKDEYSSLEEDVRDGVRAEDHLPKNINVEFEEKLTFGEHLSDTIAGFAGSWSFIAVFAGLIIMWVALNTWLLLSRPFDPYPFIMLNLVLSIITAIQAPVIIMSQNRQEVRDRLHAERDYQVSIHTELEIHRLHKKMDHLLINQGERLLEIQDIQMELMAELA
jgi:uncharacterized membrane protein